MRGAGQHAGRQRVRAAVHRLAARPVATTPAA